MDKYQENRTPYGKFMFNFMLKCDKFLMKHMWLYYLLNYTWGIIMTLVGWVVVGFIKLFFRKKIIESGKFGPAYFLMFGNNWGGLELGKSFLIADRMSESYTLHTKQHECGHTFQNAIFGPLVILLVAIPSAFRYWLSRFGKLKSEYDSAWFEGSASYFGEIYYNEKIKGKE